MVGRFIWNEIFTYCLGETMDWKGNPFSIYFHGGFTQRVQLMYFTMILNVMIDGAIQINAQFKSI